MLIHSKCLVLMLAVTSTTSCGQSDNVDFSSSTQLLQMFTTKSNVMLIWILFGLFDNASSLLLHQKPSHDLRRPNRVLPSVSWSKIGDDDNNDDNNNKLCSNDLITILKTNSHGSKLSQAVVHVIILMIANFGQISSSAVWAAPDLFTPMTTTAVPTTAIHKELSASTYIDSNSQFGSTKHYNLDTSALGPESKVVGLSLHAIADRLTVDLTKGAHGQGGYFLTGDLSRDLFRDDCVFQDPTTSVNNLDKYQRVLQEFLFEPPPLSTVELLSPLDVDETSRRITGRIRSRGYLKLPWRPYIKSYETTIIYSVDDRGRVFRQEQQWTKPASAALRETFTPSWTGRPPESSLALSSSSSSYYTIDEPKPVTRLFDYLNGRRPNEYSDEERVEIDDLIDQVVKMTAKSSDSSADGREVPSSSSSSLLTGKWILAYLQPGRDGAGIDRRIPFPEFDFNDSYQVFSFPETTTRTSSSQESISSSFSSGKVTNIGQLLGPLVTVEVSGDVREQAANEVSRVQVASKNGADDRNRSVGKRYVADITGGKICFSLNQQQQERQRDGILGQGEDGNDDGKREKKICASLPIKGEGVFESVYVGPRLRIGQNINGGGARVVQVRL